MYDEHSRNIEHIMNTKLNFAEAPSLARLIGKLKAITGSNKNVKRINTDACVKKNSA